MNEYLVIFHRTEIYPSDDAGLVKLRDGWAAWNRHVGAALSHAGGPAGRARTITANDVSISTGLVSGFAILLAENMGAALEYARPNPILLADEGRVDIIEVSRSSFAP